MKRIRVEDEYETRWIVVGPMGAVDFHCSNVPYPLPINLGRVGGVEFHNVAPWDYQPDAAPDHEHCWLVGRCWHDGTSLWASEHWIPLLERDGEAAIWPELEREYLRRFVPATEPA